MGETLTEEKPKLYPYIAQSKDAEKTFAVLMACIRGHVPLGWVGDPGQGKTATVAAVAESLGRELIDLSLSTMPPEDVSGIPSPAKMKIGNREVIAAPYTMPPWQQRLLMNPKSVLFLDEFTTAPPSTQHAFLQLVQDRRLPGSDEPFSDDVAIIIAMNPASQAGGSKLDLPIANRFSWMKFESNYNDWKEGFSMKWKSPTKMDIPCKTVPDDELEAREKKIRNLIIEYTGSSAGSHQLSFIPTGKENAGTFIKDEHDESAREVFSLAYPTPRSWENLARILPAIHDDEVDAIRDAITGTIGYAQGLKFYQYFLENRKGINIEDILKNPTKQDWKHMTINDTEGIFINLIDAAKHGRIKEVLDVYVAIKDAGAYDLLSGARINSVFKYEYFKGYSAEERKEMTEKYLNNFKDLMKKSTK